MMLKTGTRNSLIGAFILLLMSMFAALTLIEILLLFAFSVTVPLTVMLTETKKRDGELFQTYKLALTLQLPAALFAVLSFVFPQSLAAGMLSLPWLVFTIVMALYGALRLLERGIFPLEELAVDCGLLYLALGGAWFSLHRFGIVVLDFNETIILLTAIHFHFSALTAPIFTGMLGRMLVKKTMLYKITTLGMIASPMLVAVGITYSRVFEFFAVSLFVVCLFFYSYQTMKLKVNPSIKMLLFVSSGSLFLTMSFSFLYGLGRMLNIQFVSIPIMVLFHGIGNAVGFVFCGVIGWLLVRPDMKVHPYGIPHSKLVGTWKIGADFFERHSFRDEKRPAPSGLVDDFSIYKREYFDSAKLDPEIVSFYEQTLNYELISETTWYGLFRPLSRLYKAISGKVEQINLPAHGDENGAINSKIIAVSDQQDGRTNVRAWIRTNESGKAIFAAAYSTHTYHGETYMNIALPLPFGNMTGVLKLDHDQRNGLTLSSLPSGGDEGIYFHSKRFTVRLPLQEHFHVWRNDSTGLHAEHNMWLFRKKLLSITYHIARTQ